MLFETWQDFASLVQTTVLEGNSHKLKLRAALCDPQALAFALGP